MSEEISLARGYRPSSLEEYIGNEKIKETVKRVMSGPKKPQSILLTGTTGCGKTTLARILTTYYLCENPNSDGSPCGECVLCQYMKEYISTGNSEMLTDVREVDSADKGGKADIAPLLEEMTYPSYGGGWKVYIWDESHTLSVAASSLLLKTVEEPEDKVLNIFCTTDPDKMLDTLKNRAQLKLRVEKPGVNDLVGLLKRVCLSEGKAYDVEGLRLLAGRADYVIRDSLNNLETVLTSRGSATSSDVSLEFSEVSDKVVFDFYNAYLENDYMSYINVLYNIKVHYGFKEFLSALEAFTTRGIYVVNGINVEGLSPSEITEYSKVFSKFDASDIAEILSKLRKMSFGNIEANFIAFIYSSKDSNPSVVISNSPVETNNAVKNVNNEVRLRNTNLKNLEKAKIEKGRSSLSDRMEEVPVEGVLDMFKLEKVDK